MTTSTATRTLAPRSDRPVIQPLRDLRPYQMAAARAVTDSVHNSRGLSFTVVMARQAGKNELSADIELYLLMRSSRRSIDGVKCAPTFHPQAQISIDRLWVKALAANMLPYVARDGNAIRLGSARMLFLSAEPGANVVGQAGLILEVDEAQDVDAEKFDHEFRPMAAPYGATTVYYGTPWDDSTLLERAVQHNLELQRRDGVQRHFQADWTAVAEYNPGYARYVEGERARLGENHPLFLTQYALKPVPGAGRLFSGGQRAQLEGTHDRRHSPVDGETYVAGLDVGGQEWGAAPGTEVPGLSGGHDATVLTIARVIDPQSDAVVREPRVEVVEHLALTGVPHDELIARLVDVLRTWRVARVTVDATGIGETIARLLQRALGEQVVQPFKFTAGSKSNLGFGLVAAVNGGRLKAYRGDGSLEYAEFWRQVELARVAYRPSRQMNFYVDPGEGHDDYLVSLALTVHAAGEGLPQPRIARGRLSIHQQLTINN